LLVFDRQELGRIVHGAIAVVVIADRAIKKMVAEYPIESLRLCGHRLRGFSGYHHPVCCFGRTCPRELAVYFDHAGITGLNGPELLVVTNTRDRDTYPVDHVNETLFNLDIVSHIINDNLNHFCTLS
jgi:hypothetical protein